jgi:hypothetical protein
MAIIITATRIIQELIVHVTMAEKSRIMRARAVRMSSFEEQLFSQFRMKLFFARLLPAESGP